MSTQRHNPRSPDPNTLANVLDFVITSTVLNYELSFHAKVLEGVVLHTLQCTTTDLDSDGAVTEELWLDSSYIVIGEVSVDGEVYSQLGEEISIVKMVGEREETVEKAQKAAVETKQEIHAPSAEKGWKLEDRMQPYGSKLRIIFGKKYERGSRVEIKVCALQNRESMWM